MTSNDTQNNFNALLQTIASEPEKALIFSLDGKHINPGYHVTEIKHAAIDSLDCGNGADSWEEVIIQLLNGSPGSASSDDNSCCAPVSGAGYMTGSKFLGIVQAASSAEPATDDKKTIIEYSPDNSFLRKLVVDSVETTDTATMVYLTGENPRCKALERAIQQPLGTSSCCG